MAHCTARSMEAFRIALLSAVSSFAISSVLGADKVPGDLIITTVAGPDVVPSPACLCAAADGSIFVGVDLNGSLGKGPGKGRIVKLVDDDKDGVADSHTIFAEIDNPRGLIAAGDKLWVLHTNFGDDGRATGMDLKLLVDVDGDGVADGPAEPLVENICAASSLNSRGTDHSTNGIQMGIDGWIYIAIGDFGFADAIDRDGTKLSLLGGGIVRVRPDGTEMELYTTGMRNIYDVAIDPFMNVFTRGNTNDGGGWNVRFTHHIQSGEYGYPRLFINFADEIIPALEDLGGGSGVGAIFIDEPTWPETYNKQPLMADWGRKAVYLHRLTVDGSSFTQVPEEFVRVSQVSDLDLDASGQMFLSAWDGAGFKGDESKGYVVRVVPQGWTYSAAPDFENANLNSLVGLLASDSAKVRGFSQLELLSRENAADAVAGLKQLIADEAKSLECRVAALYTASQIEKDPVFALAYADDSALREFALRAATDRLPRLKGAQLPLEPFLSALNDGSPRQKVAAAIAMGRLSNEEAAEALLAVEYTRPDVGGKPITTQLDTLKGGNRVAKVKFEVAAGETLYLNLKETNPAEEPTHVAFYNPVFVVSGDKTVKLGDLTPVAGKVHVDKNPDGSELSKKAAKGTEHFVTAEVQEELAYEVPAGALRFEATVKKAESGPADGSIDFFASTVDVRDGGNAASASPRHSTPNSDIVLPHVAVKSLVSLDAVDASLAAVGTSGQDLALWALSYMHSPEAVDGLLAALNRTDNEAQQSDLLRTLARLYQKEAPYDGSWWWTTRPDTRGPYYKPDTWESSEKIAVAMKQLHSESGEEGQRLLARLNDRMRMNIDELGTLAVESEVEKMPTVDLAKISSKQGAVGTTPIEDVILSLDKLKGNVAKGEQLFAQQGCVACHALEVGGPALGPFMGQIGSIMNKEQIAVAILRPNDTISQGFQTAQVKMKSGIVHVGFVTESNSDTMTLRNMAGQVTKLDASDIEHEEHLPSSMMPPGLANALSLEEFASMVEYLASKK